MAASAEAHAEVGEVLAGKYRVERVLGAGGMGVVVAARHLQLGSLVALKFMVPSGLDVKAASERFVREAQAVARLRGEHIAHVTDFGTLDTGAPYIVMEFLEGADLDVVLKVRGRLTIPESIEYVSGACKAMSEAHAAGIVHRDLKPHNLFLTRRPDGTPLIKVLDFGISKFMGVEGADVVSTQTGTLLGSPAYMSPEQIRSSKHVDGRTDIYALGAILFQLLTGERVFRASSMGDMLVAAIHNEPRSVRELRPEVPADLDAIVARCLQKDPSKRFSTARELLMALQSVLISKYAPSITSSTGPLQTMHATPVDASGPYASASYATTLPSHVTTHATLDRSAVASSHAGPRKSRWVAAGIGVAITVVAISSVLLGAIVRRYEERRHSAEAAALEPPRPASSTIAVASPIPAVSPTPSASPVPSVATLDASISSHPIVSTSTQMEPTPEPTAKPPSKSSSTKPLPSNNPRRTPDPRDLFGTPD